MVKPDREDYHGLKEEIVKIWAKRSKIINYDA